MKITKSKKATTAASEPNTGTEAPVVPVAPSRGKTVTSHFEAAKAHEHAQKLNINAASAISAAEGRTSGSPVDKFLTAAAEQGRGHARNATTKAIEATANANTFDVVGAVDVPAIEALEAASSCPVTADEFTAIAAFHQSAAASHYAPAAADFEAARVDMKKCEAAAGAARARFARARRAALATGLISEEKPKEEPVEEASGDKENV